MPTTRVWGFDQGMDVARPKYTQLNKQFLGWLAKQCKPVTTAMAVSALNQQEAAAQRHISRQFTRLEDRGALTCTLDGTTRVCTVVREKLPDTLARVPRQTAPAARCAPPAPSIPASTSEEFLAAGGKLERLPAHWDTPTPRNGKQPVGIALFNDPFMGTD